MDGLMLAPLTWTAALSPDPLCAAPNPVLPPGQLLRIVRDCNPNVLTR
jgi:hypothetical protein